MVPIRHDPRDPVTLVALVGQFAAIMACRNCVGSAWLVHLASKVLMVAMRESPVGYKTHTAKRKWEQIADARGSKPAGEYHAAFKEYVAKAAAERPPTSKRKLAQIDVTAPPKHAQRQ
eukprot:COSAG01_NODE_2621_length_7361_cov_3.608510_2_plen_118_part_00